MPASFRRTTEKPVTAIRSERKTAAQLTLMQSTWTACSSRSSRIRGTLSHASLRIHQQPPLSAGDARAYYANSCQPVFYDRCTAAWRNITVTPRGNVILSPLCFFPPAGSIKKQPFLGAVERRGFRRLRAEIRQQKMFPACARCCMLFGSRPKYYKIKDWVA